LITGPLETLNDEEMFGSTESRLDQASRQNFVYVRIARYSEWIRKLDNEHEDLTVMITVNIGAADEVFQIPKGKGGTKAWRMGRSQNITRMKITRTWASGSSDE
jgi:hypothetical protein